jgi:dihydroxy-acid dehydratase
VVFDSIEDFRRRSKTKHPKWTKSGLVLRNFGPRGYPGMPEVGNMALPPELLRRGVTDMMRISDARMSGTAYGTVVLHVSPEAAAGGASWQRGWRSGWRRPNLLAAGKDHTSIK